MTKLFNLIAVLLVAFGQNVTGTEETASVTENLIPSKLLESVIGGDFDGIRSALANNESIDLVNSNGWSAARFAVANGDLDMLNFLIQQNIDLNNADNDGFSPLMVAAELSDKDLVEALLAANADPLQKSTIKDAKDEDQLTPHRAAVNSGRQLIALLIAEASALHGMEKEDSKIVLQALEDGAYVNIRNSAGWTPLIRFTASGDKETVKTILTKYGADANRNENDGWTALHFAAAQNNAEMAQILLNSNINHNIRNNKGQTARDIAVELKNQHVVEIIPESKEEL